MIHGGTAIVVPFLFIQLVLGKHLFLEALWVFLFPFSLSPEGMVLAVEFLLVEFLEFGEKYAA